jgi:hypothetical protein
MAPKAEKKPAKKVAKTAKTGGKKKSKAKVESFKIYIYKVLKQVCFRSCSLQFTCSFKVFPGARQVLFWMHLSSVVKYFSSPAV